MGKSLHLLLAKVPASPASAGRRLDVAKLPPRKSQLMWRPLLDTQSLSPCPGGAVIARNAGMCGSYSSTNY